ncbi:MAG TPA: ABC transporter permease [Acidimicrobiales bacterium]|jgi:branched-chain amino acid transport system permease protein|nr:ABC transporter permease [Acidimicrobiales bacterium]
MTAVVDWFAGIRTKPTRAIAVVLVVYYVVRVWTTAGDSGQLFSFTVIGIAEGCLFAIAASGLVLTYATTGVFNFAHGAVGMVSAYVFYSLTIQHGVPVPLGVLLVLVVFAPLVGLATERVMRSFRDASVQTTVVVTIALFVMCIGLAQKFWPPETGARLEPLIKGDTIKIWQANLTRDNVLALVLAVVVALALRSLLFVSRTGVAMRAVVDNPTLAGLNGAPPITIARYSWILGSVLASLSGILLASNGSSLDPIVLTLFVAGSYGAAVVGKLKSLPLTFAGAIALGVMKQHASFALPQTSAWQSVQIAIPGIFLFAALLLVPAAKLSVGRIVGARTPKVPNLPSSVVRAAVFVGAMAVVANAAPATRLFDITTGLIYALLLLSLVLLTGYSGQISLCQYVFLAMGAWAMGTFFGGHSVWGIVLGGLVAVPLGVIVSLPALRLQGLYLALVTFGFASIARDLLLQNEHFYGASSVSVGRLHLLGIKFDNDKAYLVLCAIVFAIVAIGLLALRRGSFGRRLAALRDSQAACATIGLDVRRTKLAVFTISAFTAGIAGAMFGGLKATADAIQFDPINNIVLLLFAVVGGVTTVTGALMGGALFALLPFIQSEYPDQSGLVFAGVAVAVVALGRQPNGLAGMFYEAITGRGRPGRERANSVPAGNAPAGTREVARATA